MKLTNLLDKPKIIGLIADTNEGKSNTIYAIIKELRNKNKFKLVTYGLRRTIPNTIQINSVEELEDIENSFIVVDEFFSLFDLDNRKIKAQIEQTIRLIFHNNNILLLSGLGENFKKFLSAKIHMFVYKKIKLCDLINGSRAKQILTNYTGPEKGTTRLNIPIDKMLVFDGKHYFTDFVPYMKEYDTKATNKPIFKENVQKKCSRKSVPKNANDKQRKVFVENLFS